MSTNTNHPLRVVEFDTLVEGLDYAAKGQAGYNFFSSRGELETTLTYTELRGRAIAVAQAFQQAGFARQTRVAIVAETSADFFIFFFACQYAGMIPVPLPLNIYFGAHDEYVRRLRNLMSTANTNIAVATPAFIDYVKEAASDLNLDQIGSFDDFYALPSGKGALRPFKKDEPGYIQFSSGSTMAPRGVFISQKAVTSNTRGIAKYGLEIRPGDRGMSWLPLYHDMGLVGFCLTPLLCQISVDWLSTQSFARRPLVWLKIISEHGGTLSFSPNFGYELCARRGINSVAKNYDLSHWRVAGIGGEMIYADTLNDFAETFGEIGFSPKAFNPCYGQAESTLGTTFAPPDRGLKIEHIDQERLAVDRLAVRVKANGNRSPGKSRPFVACGMALPGHQLEIRDENGKKLPDDHLGHIFITGPSLMDGYYNDPAATELVMKPDGWMDTGDLGYLTKGDLVVTGRQKDLIIINGRNIWPQDIEAAVKTVDKVGINDAACFSVTQRDGHERIVVVIHCRAIADEAREALRKAVSTAVQKNCGSDCSVVLVPPRTLRFTSSGKLSRAVIKADYCAGKIADLVPVESLPPLAQAELSAAAE